MESPSLKVLKKEETGHFMTGLGGHDGICLKVGLDDLGGFFQF